MNPEIYEINMQKAVDKERRLRFELERLIIQTLIEDSMTVTRNGERVDLNDVYFTKPKPDPLVEVMRELDWSDKYADPIRAALDALGFEIREKGQ